MPGKAASPGPVRSWYAVAGIVADRIGPAVPFTGAPRPGERAGRAVGQDWMPYRARGWQRTVSPPAATLAWISKVTVAP